MALGSLARLGREPLVAIWFGAFGFLATFLFVLPLSSKSHVVVLYILLPSTSAKVAGYHAAMWPLPHRDAIN